MSNQNEYPEMMDLSYLDAMTEQERWGCVALWLNALWLVWVYGEEEMPPEWTPCGYCPYIVKCDEIAKKQLTSLPLLWVSVLCKKTGWGTVTYGGMPPREYAREFLEGMANRLTRIADSDIDDNNESKVHFSK